MKILLLGKNGQVGWELQRALAPLGALVALDRAGADGLRGDLEDLERLAAANGAQLLVCNSHGVEVAKRLGISLLRAGFPLYDQVGGYARGWSGYRLARQALFDIANLFLGQHHDIPAYRSIYRNDPDSSTGARPPQACAGVVRH